MVKYAMEAGRWFDEANAEKIARVLSNIDTALKIPVEDSREVIEKVAQTGRGVTVSELMGLVKEKNRGLISILMKNGVIGKDDRDVQTSNPPLFLTQEALDYATKEGISLENYENARVEGRFAESPEFLTCDNYNMQPGASYACSRCAGGGY